MQKSRDASQVHPGGGKGSAGEVGAEGAQERGVVG